VDIVEFIFSFCCGESARIRGQRCSISDKIGCGIDFRGNTRCSVYFTRNSSTVSNTLDT